MAGVVVGGAPRYHSFVQHVRQIGDELITVGASSAKQPSAKTAGPSAPMCPPELMFKLGGSVLG